MLAKMMDRAKWLYQDEEGATMVEYALLVALIAVVVMAAVALIGTATKTKFEEAATKLNE
jgi:pilus assembly protein Flp/PilA